MNGIRKNFIYNLFYQILTILMPLITTPYLARVLGADRTGNYSYAYSIAYYFVLFAMLGLNNYGNREIARCRDDIEARSRKFWSIYAMQLSTSLISLLCYISYCFIVKRADVISWILVLYVISASFDINWFFWGLEEFRITVTRNTVIKIGSVAAILLLVKSQGDLYLYTTIMASSSFLSPLLLWPYLRKRIKWIRPSFPEIITHIKPNIVLFIPVIAVSLYKVMDKIMLGSMASYSEVGFYDYSEKVIAIPIACVNALGTVMLPRMANLVARQETDEEYRIIKKSIIVGTALAIAMGFGLMAIGNVFVPFFYGPGYEKCELLFYILMPSCVFLSIGNVIRTQFLIPRGKDRIFIISVVSGAVINLLVNAILIPSLQSIGAAVGTFFAEATVCVYQMIAVSKELPVVHYIKDIGILLIFGAVMFGFVYAIPFIGSGLVTIGIKIIVGAVVFCLLFGLKYKEILIELFKRNSHARD